MALEQQAELDELDDLDDLDDEELEDETNESPYTWIMDSMNKKNEP